MYFFLDIKTISQKFVTSFSLTLLFFNINILINEYIQCEVNIMNTQLLKGPVTKSLLLFSLPMILGNLLQQLYNIADTFIVGQYIGSQALAAVGSSLHLWFFSLLLF